MNTRSFFVVLATLLLFAHQLPGQVLISPDNPKIEYTGRLDFSNSVKPGIGFSGVAIDCEFSGSSIKVRFSSASTTNYYFYSIDESEPVKIHLAKTTTDYLLSSSLADTLHHLSLVRLTEGSQGTDYFEGIVLNSGDTLAAMPVKNRKIIEFYGNSITCGYGNETNKPTDGFKPEQENFYFTYASFASRLLDAGCIGISVSGIGMYRNYGGPVTGSPDNMLTKYDRILFYDNNKKWNFTGYTPDVVCVNLGTNDTSNGLFDEAIFTDSCRSLLMKLRSHYPDALIVYLTGPMMSSTATKKVSDAVQTVLDEMNDPKISKFHMSTQTGEFGLGGDYHPTVAQHWKNALELENYLKGLTKWAVAPYFMSAQVAVDGMSVQVEVSELLTAVIPKNGIEIMVDNELINSTAAFLSDENNHTFVVSLSKRIRQDQKVYISYWNGGIRSTRHVKLLPFYNKEAGNPVKETSIISAAVDNDGSVITSQFNKSINGARADSILLLVDGLEINSVKSVTPDPENDKQVVITLDEKIFKSQSVSMQLSTGAVTGTDGVMNDAVLDFHVDNNSLNTWVTESSVSEGITAFPNPTGDRFTLSGSKSGTIKRIDLYDGNGRLVAIYKVTPDGSYDISGLARGIYYCRIWLRGKDKEVVTLKMVKR